MCSVIGFSGEYDEKTLSELFFNSRVRGLHAFGFSYLKKSSIETLKFLSYDEFLNTINRIKPDKFIAHFRYSTSGDYLTLENNQPIESKNSSLAFNGVLDMRTKTEMEYAYGVKMRTENDGEIALLKMEKSEDELIKYLSTNGTFAGLFLNNKNNLLSTRNTRRPLYRAEKNGNIYYASTNDIMVRSGIETAAITTPNIIYHD